MHKHRFNYITSKIGKGMKFNYMTSKNAFKNVSGIQNLGGRSGYFLFFLFWGGGKGGGVRGGGRGGGF